MPAATKAISTDAIVRRKTRCVADIEANIEADFEARPGAAVETRAETSEQGATDDAAGRTEDELKVGNGVGS